MVTVVGSSLRDSAVLAGDLVLDLVCFIVLDVDGTDQAILCKTISYEPLNHEKIDTHEKCFRDVHGTSTMGHQRKYDQLCTCP